MKPKAITFFDLDGTLLDQHSKITPEISLAMKQLKDNNVLPVIATGRTNIEITEIAKAAGITSFITMNGQHVTVEGKGIYDAFIPTDVIERLYQLTQEKGHELGFYNSKGIFITNFTPKVKEAYDFVHTSYPPVDPKYYLKDSINMMLILSEDGDEDYHKAFPELKFFRNGPESIDTISHTGSKGEGVKKLLTTLGYENVPTYGFGDGPNDLELLEACDYKIAMGNGKKSLKEMADFVTKKNIDGGIVYALKHFGLLD